MGVLKELCHQNVVLLLALADALLCLLRPFYTMADDNSWNFSGTAESWQAPPARLLLGCQSSSMLLVGCLGSLLKQSVHAFIQIVRCHVIVNCPDARYEYRVLILGVRHVV